MLREKKREKEYLGLNQQNYGDENQRIVEAPQYPEETAYGYHCRLLPCFNNKKQRAAMEVNNTKKNKKEKKPIKEGEEEWWHTGEGWKKKKKNGDRGDLGYESSAF